MQLLTTIYNYGDKENSTTYNYSLDIISNALTFFFFLESTLKIIASGFALHQYSYLRDPWNIIDFIIVLSGLLDFLLMFTLKVQNKLNLKSLRNLRVLRPLKSINQIPTMKRLVSTLFRSFPDLVNVTIFLSFIFSLLGILGTQLWNKSFYNRCRVTQFPLNQTFWEKSLEFLRPCSNDSWGGYHCPNNLYCGNPLDYGISIKDDGAYSDPTILFAIPTFDNFYKSILGQFQMITKDNWSAVMSNMMDSYSGPIAVLYCSIIILVTADFIMNLILAVFCEAFKKEQQILEQEKLEELEKEFQLRAQMEIPQTLVTHKTSQGNLSPLQHKQEQNFERQDSWGTSQIKEVEKNYYEEEKQEQKQNDINPLGELFREFGKNERKHIRNFSEFSQQEESSLKENQSKQESQNINKKPMVQSLAKLFQFGQQQNTNQQQTTENKEEQQDNPLLRAVTKKIYQTKDIKDIQQRLKVQKDELLQNNLFLQKLKVQIRDKVSQDKNKQYGLLKEQDTLSALHKALQNRMQKQETAPEELKKESEKFSLILHKEIQLQNEKKQIMEKFKNSLTGLFPEKQKREEIIEKLNKQIYQDEIEKRNQNNTIFKKIAEIILSKSFNRFILLAIFGNTLLLTFDRYQEDQNDDMLQNILNKGNFVFFGIFTLELILKLIGLGFKNYFKDIYNTLDFFVLLTNLIDVVLYTYHLLQESHSSKSDEITVFKALRAFRLIRIFKLAKQWRALNNMIILLVKAIKDISTFCVLLLLFIFTYTILGLEWFSYKVKLNSQFKVDLENGTYIDSNFNAFIQSFTTTFTILTGDNWCDIFYKHYRSISGSLASFYFLSLKIVGQYVLLLLLLAILIEHFDEESFSFAQTQERKNKIIQSIRTWLLNLTNKGQVENKEISIDQQGGSKTDLEKEQANWRVTLKKIVKHKVFDYVILTFIILSSVHLALDNPLLDPQGTMALFLQKADIFLSTVFCLEAFIKILALGIIRNGQESYFRSAWNIMDFCIVLISVYFFAQIIQILSLSISQIDLEVLKVIRILRVLRPLRVISKNQGLQLSIKALFSSMPSILNASLISLFFYFIFAIIGVSFYKGLFFYCHYNGISYLAEIDKKSIVTGEWHGDFKDKLDCMNYGGEWLRYDSNFDYIGSALTVLFPISQTYSFSVPMYWSTYAVGIDKIQKQNSQNYNSLYFIIFVIVMNYLITNLFVGVVVAAYNREKDKVGENFMMTEEQKHWSKTKLILVQSKPMLYLKQPNFCWRKPFYALSRSKKFEKVILVMIGINTLSLVLVWDNQSETVERIIFYSNIVFTLLFDLEILIKVTGLGMRYFAEKFNIFDFIVGITSTVGLLFEIYMSGNQTISNALRSFRIGRIFKLFRKHPSLNAIFQAFIFTLPALVNVGGLLLLLIFIYSILTMNFFATLQLGSTFSENFNFQTVTNSIITLYVLQTGNNFYEYFSGAQRGNSILFECINNPSFKQYQDNNNQTIGCGNFYAAILIFYSFAILVGLIFLNLFIAIILQGYQESVQQNKKLFNSKLSDKFRKVWSYFDQDATGFIKIEQFPSLMMRLGQPLGWSIEIKNDKQKFDQYMKLLSIKVFDKCKVRFVDVLEELVMLAVINQEINSYFTDKEKPIEEFQDKREQEVKEKKEKLSEILKSPTKIYSKSPVTSFPSKFAKQKITRNKIEDEDEEVEEKKEEENKNSNKQSILNNLVRDLQYESSNSSLIKKSSKNKVIKKLSLRDLERNFEEEEIQLRYLESECPNNPLSQNMDVEELDLNDYSELRDFLNQSQLNDLSMASRGHESAISNKLPKQ